MKAFLGAKVVLTAMILATVAANSLEAQTFTSSPNVAIPDSPAAGVSDTINVTGVTGAITSLRVDVRIDHTWDSDLDIWLIPPGTNWSGPYRNGAPPAGVIDLSTDNGGSGDNYGSGAGPITYAQFSSSTDPTTPGTVTVVGAAAPFTAGVYIPEGTAAFDALYNTISPNGAWTLAIGDDTGSDTGTLISWQIVVVGGAAGQPEIAVTRGSNGVADGGTDAVGTLVTGSATSLTYTIDNLGLQDLTLTTPFAAPGGLTNCTASISTQPTSPVTSGNSTTLVVDVTPTTATTWSCTITFANNDPDENPFDFTISGDANSPALAIADSSPGAAIVFRPTTDRVVAAFTATSAAGGQTISGVDVAKTGTLVDGEISAVKLWRDVNNNGVLDSGTDTQAGSTQTFASGTASFTGLSEVVTNPTVGNFLITFSLPANATIGNTMGCDVTAVTATPGAVSGTPTTGPVHTVGGSVSALPFMDDFEPATVITNRAIQITGNFPSGTTTPLGSTTFGADAQVQVGITTGTTSPLGTQHAMIDFPNGDACGAIDYAFDLSAYNANSNTLVLSFDYAENGDESDAEDGVYLSLDGGATWVLNLNVLANGSATYTTRTVDVSAALVGASLNYTNQVIIRFQGQDNSSNPGGDGHFFDNIQLFEPNEMDVLRGATGVAVSATDNVDIVSAGSNITYTIENNGGSPLNLTGASPFVVVTGVTNINTVTVTGIPTTPIAAGGNTTFTINVVPTTASVSGDAYSFTVSIANDDSDENPYDFTVSGNAFTNVPPAVSVPGT
ncbi:MAG: hypothetical protein KDB68_16995, partial [Planctomycetes bacterium]|nr:hypothetical protein [Planctomycetota bacterium]